MKNLVTDFYNSDEIRTQAPGKRDVRTITENGTRVNKQIRRMKMSVGEAFKEYKIKNPA